MGSGLHCLEFVLLHVSAVLFVVYGMSRSFIWGSIDVCFVVCWTVVRSLDWFISCHRMFAGFKDFELLTECCLLWLSDCYRGVYYGVTEVCIACWVYLWVLRVYYLFKCVRLWLYVGLGYFRFGVVICYSCYFAAC